MRNIKKLIIKRILQAPADGARMHVRKCLGLGAVNPGRAGFPSTTQAGDLVAGSHLPEPGPLGPQMGVVKPLPQMLVGESSGDFLRSQKVKAPGWKI